MVIIEANRRCVKKMKSLYIHFPFCRHLCNYCDFYKKIPESPEDFSHYEKQLAQMFEHHELLMKKKGYEWQALESLYVGGGTPSLWGARGAHFLDEAFQRNNIHLNQDGEFTLEVNPGSWTREGLEAWKQFGINRYSLGIQSLNPFYLKKIDRVHSVDDVAHTLNYFNEEKLNFSVDFILGLPRKGNEPRRDILEELEQILEYKPSHISLYILTVKNHYVFIDEMPDDEQVAEEYMLVNKRLEREGFVHYEVSNYSMPGFESKHNLMYWRSETVAALGPSAVGYLSEEGFRYKWKPAGCDYVGEQLTDSEKSIEKLYMSLRVSDGISLSELDIVEKESLVKSWCERGLACFERDRLKLTSHGYLNLDSLMDEIFNKMPK